MTDRPLWRKAISDHPVLGRFQCHLVARLGMGDGLGAAREPDEHLLEVDALEGMGLRAEKWARTPRSAPLTPTAQKATFLLLSAAAARRAAASQVSVGAPSVIRKSQGR
ncbi:hypothetical protein [uncultured Thiodictyon sp.]|uniref:hypothetical protein n=1 Tax=uncultured Thiodictyon sp. TaxID=1846217 RepID=UPI0025CDA111|nr:hypothetical protein [uncultured Thiodictyon sp.]